MMLYSSATEESSEDRSRTESSVQVAAQAEWGISELILGH